MNFTFSDTDKVVQHYLNSINVKYAFHYIGAVVTKDSGKNWENDLFTVSFSAAGKETMNTDYKTGTGHRIALKTGN